MGRLLKGSMRALSMRDAADQATTCGIEKSVGLLYEPAICIHAQPMQLMHD